MILVTFHCWVEDANTPFRLMRAVELEEVLKEIPAQYFLANVLMTVRYTKEGRRVMYYPITFRPRQGGVNSINMKKIVKIGKTTLKDFRKWEVRTVNEKRKGIWKAVILTVLFMSAQVLLKRTEKYLLSGG